jgi:hypothetical protein
MRETSTVERFAGRQALSSGERTAVRAALDAVVGERERLDRIGHQLESLLTLPVGEDTGNGPPPRPSPRKAQTPVPKAKKRRK